MIHGHDHLLEACNIFSIDRIFSLSIEVSGIRSLACHEAFNVRVIITEPIIFLLAHVQLATLVMTVSIKASADRCHNALGRQQQ